MANITIYQWVEYVSTMWSYDRNHVVKACNDYCLRHYESYDKVFTSTYGEDLDITEGNQAYNRDYRTGKRYLRIIPLLSDIIACSFLSY